MPRVKALTESENRDRKIISQIAGEMAAEKKSNEHMAKALGMSLSTWMRRMKSPGDFTVAELRKVHKILPGTAFEI